MSDKEEMLHPDLVISMDLYDRDIGVFKSSEKHNEYFYSLCGEVLPPMPANSGARAHYTVDSEGQEYLSMIIPNKKNIGHVAHEASHIADFFCHMAGLPISYEATEVRAYIVGYIVQQIADGLK